MGAVSKIEAQEVTHSNIITPQDMIQQAIQAGSGIEVMERLLALQERHDAFQARKAFDDAMADLRKTLPRITKSREVDFANKTGGRTQYKFEDLAEITEALSEPMSDVGLSWRWYTENVQTGVKVTCRITHRAGHFEETSLVGPLDASGNKNPIQAIGSAVSYLQRYTLKAAVGIAAAHDDDAQEVSRKREPEPKQQQRPSAFEVESKRLREAATIPALQKAWIAITNISEADLPQAQFDQLSELCNERQAALSSSPAPKAEAPDPYGFNAMESEIPFPGELPPETSEAVRNLRA